MRSQINTIEMLKNHEGFRFEAYQCTEGVWTIGYGHTKNVLEGDEMTKIEAERVLFDDIVVAIADALDYFPHFMRLTHNRQAVLIDMSFNLGLPRLEEFKKLKEALFRGLYKVASEEMLDSTWANQVGVRAKRLAKLMEEG